MNTLKKLLGLLILIVSLVLLAWGLWPVETTKANEPLQAGQMQLPPGDESANTQGHEGIQSLTPGQPAGVTEARSVVLEYPVQMREGDSDVIMLTLDVAANGQTATAQFADHSTLETAVQIPNVYETHVVQAEAQIDLPGVTASPAEPIVLQVLPGLKVPFIWTVKPELAGTYRGVVRIFLIFTPISGGESTRQALYAQALGIDVINLFGIGGQPARLMGLAGSVIGAFISVEDVVKWIFGRGKKTNRKKKR
jgi:hypothetical protein